MSIERAIKNLEEEVGNLKTPEEGTREWWLLRAKSLGLSLLRSCHKQEFSTVQAEEFRKDFRSKIATPDAEATLPPGVAEESR